MSKNIANYPLVTVGIPTYNRANSFLPKTIESVLNQSYYNIELIVSDNCSKDNTELLITQYNDKRIRYFKQIENIPYNENINFCLNKANGDYFLLLCDDDFIDKDFVDSCIRTANNKEYGMIRTGMRIIDEYGKIINERQNCVSELPVKEFFAAWFSGGKTPMHLCCTLFNTQKLQEVGGFKSKKNLFIDVVPAVLLAAKYERLDIKDVKASYRKHSSSMAQISSVKDWCIDSRYLLDIMIDLIDNNDKSFRRSGNLFFANHCYRYARNIKSSIKKVDAYYTIYKSFDYSGKYFANKLIIKPIYSFMKKIMRKINPSNVKCLMDL